MTIKSRVEKLEGITNLTPDTLLVSPNDDGTFTDAEGNVYTRQDFKHYNRVLIFEPHKPKGLKD